MSNENNKALVRHFVDQGWNQKKLAVFDKLLAPSFTHHDTDFPSVSTAEHYKQWFTETQNAFPDFQLTIDDMIAEEDKVATLWTFRGTNTGDIATPMHIPATGRRVTVSGVTVTRIVGGQFVNNWQHGDTMSFMQQLGVLPVPGQ